MTGDLVAFLLARIAKDEELRRGARTWTDRDWHVFHSPRDNRVTIMDGDGANVIAWIEADGEPGLCIGAHIARYDPARTRTDIEAKRALVEAAVRILRSDLSEPAAVGVADLILEQVAVVYREHPDYKAEWAPEADG